MAPRGGRRPRAARIATPWAIGGASFRRYDADNMVTPAPDNAFAPVVSRRGPRFARPWGKGISNKAAAHRSPGGPRRTPRLQRLSKAPCLLGKAGSSAARVADLGMALKRPGGTGLGVPASAPRCAPHGTDLLQKRREVIGSPHKARPALVSARCAWAEMSSHPAHARPNRAQRWDPSPQKARGTPGRDRRERGLAAFCELPRTSSIP